MVIEVDGNVHNAEEAKEYDESRTNDLANVGIQVLRFTNDEVEKDMPSILKRITDFITKQEN